MFRAILSAACAALMLSGCPSRSAAPDLRLSDGWARATAPGQSSGAAYLTIDNRGERDDRLVTVATTRAATATIHQSTAAGGIMRMRMLATLPVAAGERLTLSPGGTHIMLAPLTAPLKPGETLELTMRFEHGGERRIPVTVVAPGAR
ncbi:MAG: copper chaperone PCu(A)C [Sphingomicrobium sp.]